ncbi:hypothetical protein B0T17DRAFT_503938 [Bombardia bombarda]|uniref:Uncharacterized protein n=1 Tax=Bombardia bombarda TaxID=252184 RepID=A0AA39XNY6_9PEZI|nr:hypothetical protein B0T17DRAFT_503938 [Bombardia bombarda]
MGRGERNPTIRILVLGAAGVGKNCLESRFTTMTYPPLYDPDLTLHSRRLFTLSQHAPAELETATTRPLDTADGPRPPSQSLNVEAAAAAAAAAAPSRPRTASTTFSNPGSSPDGQADTLSKEAESESETAPEMETSEKEEDGLPPPSPPPCDKSKSRRDASYMVEVINYPALQIPKVRAHFFAKGEYDAVLLVYDVGNRQSFDAIPDLHAEIPLARKRAKQRKASSGRLARRTCSGFWGMGVGGGGGQPDGLGNGGSGTNESSGGGRGETVVALIGNKSDFDDDHASIDLVSRRRQLDKEAVLQEADIEERSLLHPLYRDSWLREIDALPLSPTSVQSVPVAGSGSIGQVAGDIAVDVRRSILSEGAGPRSSAFSARRSLDSVPEGREQYAMSLPNMPPTPPEPSNEDIEKWVETGSNHVTGSGAGTKDKTSVEAEQEEEECTRVDSSESGAIAAGNRKVTQLEGGMLARSLLLNIPFYETSAKTGENVEEVFEDIVREVLREMGKEPEKDGKHGDSKHDKKTKEEERPLSRSEREGATSNKKAGQKLHGASPTLLLSDSAGEGRNDKSGVGGVLENIMSIGVNAQTPPAPAKRREESFLGRFKSIFTRRSAVMVSDVAA